MREGVKGRGEEEEDNAEEIEREEGKEACQRRAMVVSGKALWLWRPEEIRRMMVMSRRWKEREGEA